MKNSNQIIIAVLVAIIALGAGFFAGMQFQKSQNPNSGQYAMMRGGNARFGNRASGGRAAVGKVISQDTSSITIQLQDGSSKIVLISNGTMFAKTNAAALSDIKTGDKIMVFGTTNSDGSISAQNVQINPPQRQDTTPTPTQ